MAYIGMRIDDDLKERFEELVKKDPTAPSMTALLVLCIDRYVKRQEKKENK